ncbi:MAG TPA: SLBB domain-containing protein [Planctomycetota bacterium]|nr:SLBB domain-containing protein [Planctomycetota bacterium]
MRSASSLALAILLSGCFSAEDYTPDKVPKPTDAALGQSPPPVLPPPVPPQDLSELRSSKVPLDQLRVGDVLSITVRDEPELSLQKARVRPDGMLRLPWMGEIKVAGKTRRELQTTLEETLTKGYVKSADVTVELHADECRRVYVLGRVARPGTLTLPIEERITLVQLVALAGGFTTAHGDLEADPTAIRLIRTINGQRKEFRVSFETIVEREQLDQDVFIEPGDEIYVPPKKELHIFGSVRNPGTFALADGSRLSIDEALSLAGGFSGSADRAHVTLIRHGDTSGSAEAYRVNLLDDKVRAATQVTASDTIIVSDQQRRRVFVLGNVGRQGSYELDEEGLTVTKCLALAGGLTRIADGDAVRLYRATPEGRKVYRVPVNTIMRKNQLENDPVLIPGDLIFVPESFF